MNRRTELEGFTLVELLVAMTLFGVLGTLLLAFSIGSSRVADEVRRASNVNGDARLAIERLARDLRQAERIEAASVDARGRVVAITIAVDLDGSGLVDTRMGSGEILTYTWDEGGRQLLLSDGRETAKVLADKVLAVDVRLQSSAWMYDLDGDGTTTWREIDASSVGDGDGLPGPSERAMIDLVTIDVLIRDGGARRRLVVQTDMRNAEANS